MNFQNANFTAGIGEYNVVNTSDGDVICSLPDSVEWGDDSVVRILLHPAGLLNSLTIDPVNGQTINGASTLVLDTSSAVKHVKLVTGGGNWYTF